MIHTGTARLSRAQNKPITSVVAFSPGRCRPVLTLCVFVVIAALLGSPKGSGDLLRDEKAARSLKEKFLQITSDWTRDVVFKKSEQTAMEQGKQWEDLMMKGLNDPASQKLLLRGEPSFASVESSYPGKVLDRAVLGTYSSPDRPPREDGSDNEFMVWWNGAISANLLKGKLGPNVQPLAENTNIVFRVGASAEMFGLNGEEFSRIKYEEAYLPIINMIYTSGAFRYRQTLFADRPAGEEIGFDTAFVQMQITNLSSSSRQAELHEDVILMDGDRCTASGQRILDRSGAAILIHSDPDSTFDDRSQRLTHRFNLKPEESASVYFKIPYLPDAAGRLHAPTAAAFHLAHTRVHEFWADLVAKGMQIATPEPLVNHVWRALLAQNFILADGQRFTYGSGLRYNDSFYPVENGFGANDFAFYGFADYSRQLLPYFMPVSLDPEKAGRKYQNRRAVVLHHLLENYRLTGKTDLFESFKPDILRVAEEIIADRKSTMKLEGGKRPLHWGLLPAAKPAADDLGDKEPMYVVAHNITNCQGLQDLGQFLIRSGIDRPRGERYLAEAKEFRKTILDAMEKSVIRTPGYPPFVELQTLYFRETPGYGPDPYDDLAMGRVQGTYYHYWADMQFGYHFFNPDDQVARWISNYLEQRGGFVLGCTRARRQAASSYGWINNVYNAGYYDQMIRSGEVDKFLLGFYARLAFAMTRYAWIASEGSPFVGYNTRNGGSVSADFSFPNSAANSETLRMLRSMLVYEELRDNVETGNLHLLRAAPRPWFEAGKRIELERAPTFFGEISFTVDSRINEGRINADIRPPARERYTNLIVSFRHPRKSPIRRVQVNGSPHRDFDAVAGTVRLPYGAKQMKVEAFY